MKRKFDSLEDAARAGFCVIHGDGWYSQGGEMVSRADYPALFKALSGYGSFDRSTTFNLPDLRLKPK